MFVEWGNCDWGFGELEWSGDWMRGWLGEVRVGMEWGDDEIGLDIARF